MAVKQILVQTTDSDLEKAAIRYLSEVNNVYDLGWNEELTWRVTVICRTVSKPTGLVALSELSKTMVTLAFVTPAWPLL